MTSQVVESPATRQGRAARILLALLIALAVVSAIVFACHLFSVVRDGALAETTGFEGVEIYDVWKVARGELLYEWPDKDPYNVAPYNAGFYYLYGGVIRALRISDESLTLTARLITLVFTVAGAVAQYALIRTLVPDAPRYRKAIAAMVAFVSWFGQLVSWWSLTVRPDVPAIALETIALAMLAHAGDRVRFRQLFAASMLFSGAWLFKQNMIGMLGGAGVFLLFVQRDFKRALALGLPVVLVIAMSLALGGENYRYNLIGVQSVFPMSLRAIVVNTGVAMLVTPLFWGLLMVVLLTGAWRSAWRADGGMVVGRISAGSQLVLCAAGVSLVAMLLGMSKAGAVRAYAMESSIPAGTLAAVAMIRCGEAAARSCRVVTVGADILTLAMMVLPVVQFFGPPFLGQPMLLTESMRTIRQSLLTQLDELPKPLYVNDPIFSLPWHASDGKYPAFTLDRCYLPYAQAAWRIRGQPPSERIKSRWFRALLLEENDPLYPIALENGYAQVAKAETLDERALLMPVEPASP